MTQETVARKDTQRLQRAIVDGLEDVKGQDIAVFNTEHLSPLFERRFLPYSFAYRPGKGAWSAIERVAHCLRRGLRHVASGDIDVAIAWGPLGGYFAALQRPQLRVTPVRPAIDGPLPMAFAISMGVRPSQRCRLSSKLAPD